MIEKIFGRMKQAGGMKKPKLRGLLQSLPASDVKPGRAVSDVRKASFLNTPHARRGAKPASEYSFANFDSAPPCADRAAREAFSTNS